jgi:N,N'-diacetyllegionaminate synthase
MSVYIIAEAGVNHNGSLERAKKLVDIAVEAGADCVKFQTFVAASIVSKNAGMADYQKENTGVDESQYAMLKRLELKFEDFAVLKNYCEERKIAFLSTAFDFASIAFLASLPLSQWKIPSGEITNLPYLIRVAETRKPVILSTGMAEMAEIQDAVRVLRAHGTTELTLLHCTTEYPAPFAEVNLRAMETLKQTFGAAIGYSDHTTGIEVPIAAVALGATMIEKHFTSDRTLEGPDHKASLEPAELKEMVRCIRNIEKALGSSDKRPGPSEIKNKAVARKSILAKRAIKQGEVFTEENLDVKRPGTGISPMRWFEVLGKTAIRDFAEDEMIEL